MNGAMGTCQGYMWPEGGDPNSSNSRSRSPLCLLIEFDDVNLRGEHGRPRSFFSDDEPEKSRWVPIFKQTVWSLKDEGVSREQYPLVLAWALTQWKAQGMTLAAARVHLFANPVGVAGLAFVACTRVRHPWDLVFEEDLPEFEEFMKAKKTPAFRRRRRWELRLQHRASETIRSYGFCEEDEWRKEEAGAATEILRELKRVAESQRETLRDAGRYVDEDSWLWGDNEPQYEVLLRGAVRQLRQDDQAHQRPDRSDLLDFVSKRLLDRVRRRVLSSEDCAIAEELLAVGGDEGLSFDDLDVVRSVAGTDEERYDRCVEVARLLRRRMDQVGTWDGRIEEEVPADMGELHLPSAKEALVALIPAKLHKRLDKAAAK